MDFPQFELPRLGAGMLVAIISIVHVCIAHLAVGAGLFIAVAHTRAIRSGDALVLDFLKRYSRYLVPVAFVAGAVTGVGIWVTISLVSPVSTSALIHQFVWAWAIEWVFFLVEIAAGYVYYYGWGRLTPKRHAAVAWIYFIGAYMSLFVINGIVAFMLTPGTWKPPAELVGTTPQAAFWAALFNPSFWPSVLIRTISSLAFAGISVALLANAVRSYSREERRQIISGSAYLLLPIVLMAPLGAWYFTTLPHDARTFAFGGAFTMTVFFAIGIAASVCIAGSTLLALFRQRGSIGLTGALALLGLALMATASMEFVREGVRKPYLIHGYLYSNGIYANDAMRERLNREGVLAHAPFALPPGVPATDLHALPLHEAGRYVYNVQCRMCHEPGGTNAMEARIRGASRERVMQMTRELDTLHRAMPPFVGSEFERQALVEYQLYLAAPQEYTRSGDCGSSAKAVVSEARPGEHP